jgi:hypothetical protein
MVRLFLTVAILPAIQQCEQLHSSVQKLTPDELFLVIREVPAFFDYSGPRTDLFAPGRKPVSVEKLISTAVIWCWGEAGKSRCRGVQAGESRPSSK